MRLMVALKRLEEAAPRATKEVGDEVPSSGEFVLRDVTFGWSPDAEPVVRGLSLNLRPGDHLAVLGPSGIGKSTLASLLTGLMPPDFGSVLFGGAPADLVVPT